LSQYYIDAEVRGKTVAQTRIEKRIRECHYDLNKKEIIKKDEIQRNLYVYFLAYIKLTF
jgi:hypothetical protein